MIISKNENHSPELESFVEGENGAYFRTDSSEDLAAKLAQFHAERGSWSKKREAIVLHCQQHYSVERMVTGFLESCVS
jgi:hypothetical protein